MRKEKIAERNKEICCMYRRGMSFRQIAERYTIHPATVRNIVLGNPRMVHPVQLTQTENKVYRLARLGVYAGEIAEALNLSLREVAEAIAVVKRKQRTQYVSNNDNSGNPA